MSEKPQPDRPSAGECVAPVLPMRDAETTAAFYARLGFHESRRYGEPVRYLVVRRGWMELHFFSHPTCDPATSIAGAFIRVSDVDRFTAGFESVAGAASGSVAGAASGSVAGAASGSVPRYLAPDDKPWCMRQAALVDPDGNLIQFGTLLPQNQASHQPAR
ncbi:MAG: bleomycin resistance protein [Bosea sp. (in: a-proteobacteria)]